MRILIKQGRIICPKNKIDKIADLAISDHQIIAIENDISDFNADHIIHAENQWVLPGLVDLYARPQMQHPQGVTLHHEALSALTRGITTICIAPENVIDTRSYQASANAGQLPRLYAIAPLTEDLKGESLCDLARFKEAGFIAVGQGSKPIENMRLLKQCYEYAATFDLQVVIQPQNAQLTHKGVIHEGIVSTRLGLPGIPETAETLAIAEHLLLIEQCGVQAHFTCLSSQKGVALIRQAKEKGLPVTCDVAMTHLHLTELDLMEFNSNCHLNPPLRTIEDQTALLAGIKDGTIDAICSNHQPLDRMAKLAPLGETQPGMSILDVYLSLALNLIHQNKIDKNIVLAAITHQAAQCFSLECGTLTVGKAADVIVVDPNAYWVPDSNNLLSKGKNCYFEGWELPGKITATVMNGYLLNAV